jgi:hypothetical protein
MPERRKLDRRTFSQYMRVMNEFNGELVGHLADISTGGFKLESVKPIDINQDFTLHIDLTNEISSKPYMVFNARSRWCQKDQYDPTLYNVGFQIVEMTPEDLEIFVRMFEKYGTQSQNNRGRDYLWK